VYLTDQLNNAASFLDLALGLSGEVTCLHDERYLGDSSFAEDLGVTECE
jgi:hypothetical protein